MTLFDTFPVRPHVCGAILKGYSNVLAFCFEPRREIEHASQSNSGLTTIA
jgi:hypothetical protein